MKQTIQFALAIAASAAAMFAYMYEAPAERVVQEVAYQEVLSTLDNQLSGMPVLTGEERRKNLTKLTSTLNSLGGRQLPSDQQELGIEERLEATSVSRKTLFEKISVEPWNPSKIVCTPEPLSNDGVERCEETFEFPRHHYYSATTAELLELAYTDALAAKIASDRIGRQDPEVAFKLQFHATALSGKAKPLVDAAHLVPAQLDASLPATDSDYVFFALISIAEKLGYDYEDPVYSPAYFSLDSEKLNDAIRSIEIELAELQTTTLGSNSLRELFDV